MKKKTKQKVKQARLKPISLYPLKPEQALKLFMQVNPESVGIKLRGK